MFVRLLGAALLASPLPGASAQAPSPPEAQTVPEHPWSEQCDRWDEWDKPGPAFTIFGNTHYVGTCGIASILITSDQGHVLIDSGTSKGAEIVLGNIKKLGFDPKDIKLLLNSHEHFDHVGGMAMLQRETGAQIVSSEIGAWVMRTGQDHPADPQYGLHDAMEPVERATAFTNQDGDNLLEKFSMTAVMTPGHTPGAMSWSWQSCEALDCRTIVYADSLSAVSKDDYRFVDNENHTASFIRSLEWIESLKCDILLTPHPSASELRVTLGAIRRGERYSWACSAYANGQKEKLSIRLAKELEETAKEGTKSGSVE